MFTYVWCACGKGKKMSKKEIIFDLATNLLIPIIHLVIDKAHIFLYGPWYTYTLKA